MAAETTNYGLTKPTANESYDITVFNQNADLIDAALKELEESKAEGAALAAHEADGVKHVTAAERTAWNAKAAGDHTHTAAEIGAATPAALNGYLPLSGGTLTGDLTIVKTAGAFWMKDTAAGRRSVIQQDQSGEGVALYNQLLDGSVGNSFKLLGEGAVLKDTVLIITKRAGSSTTYRLYGEHNKPTPADIGAAAASHSHGAGDITSGTLPVARGGTGAASISDTTYTTARYRASALVSTETNPTANGVINWTYE